MSTIFDEFCRETTAFINPTDCIKPLSEFPEICITTFSQNIITEFIENNNTKIIANLYSANGILPVYEIKYDDASVGVFLSRVGAPACVVGLEEIIALGAKKIIQFVKKRIEGGANEKAVLRLFINCPFVCINFDFFWLNKARQLYMDF